MIKKLTAVMENTLAYRLWQAPFAEAKFAPVLRHNDMTQVSAILDVGCGPGTNRSLFTQSDYLGVDINPKYIEFARRRYGGRFEVADVRDFVQAGDEQFDFILLNSLLHHIEDDNVHGILSRLPAALSDDGHVHIIDLVLPEERGIARYLAKNDRGDWSRPLHAWQQMFEDHYHPVVFEPFAVRLLGVTLWHLVYFKGRRKS